MSLTVEVPGCFKGRTDRRSFRNRVGYHRQLGRKVRNPADSAGKSLRPEESKEWSQCGEVLLMVCGRYEGFDERVRELVDEEVSGGDCVCLGGEVIAMLIIESVSRWCLGYWAIRILRKPNRLPQVCWNIRNTRGLDCIKAWKCRKNCCPGIMAGLKHGERTGAGKNPTKASRFINP